MNDENTASAMFAAGDYGTTIARNLLRSLALKESEAAISLLDVVLAHPLIERGIRSAAGETLLADVEQWLEGSDVRLEYQHALLVARALDRLNIAPDWHLDMLLMVRAYAAGDHGLAKKMATEALRDAGRNNELITRCHELLGRLHSDRQEFSTAAKHFAAGAKAAHAGKLYLEEWDRRTNFVWCMQAVGDHLGALREIHVAEKVARRIKRADALAKTLLDRGNSEGALGNHEKARRAYEGALAAAEQAGDRARQSDALGNLGGVAHVNGDYATAADFHRRALSISRTLIDKGSAQADLNNLAQALWEEGLSEKSEEAVKYQEEALQIAQLRNDEAHATQYLERLNYMHQTLGRYVAQQPMPAQSPQPNSSLFREAPVSPLAGKADYEVEKQVRSLLNQGAVEPARQFLEQHLQEAPDSWNARCLYGTVLAIGGDDEKARVQFERAIELCPEALDPHYRLVDLSTKTGQLDSLRVRYEQAVAADPYHAALRLGLSLIYSRQERRDDAIRLALEAVRLAPGAELSLRVLAETQLVKARLLLTSDWDRAWLIFQDCASTLNHLTRLDSEQKGQWLTFAARAFEQFAIESHQINPPFTVGMESRELAILAHAGRFYRQAQEVDPLRSTEGDLARVTETISVLGSPDQITIAGGHLQSDGFPEEALVLLMLSLQIDPEQAEAFYQLAQTIYGMGGPGRREAALNFVIRAIQIDPHNPVYRHAERHFREMPEVPLGPD